MAYPTKTIRIDQTGGPEQLKLVELEVGEPGPGEIRIRHHAIGLNFIDVYHRTGLYPLPLPAALGMEGAGVVEAVGEGVAHLKPGDRAAYAGGPPGSYSERRVMPALPVCKLPDAISFETGAAMMLKGLTAQYLLKRTLPQGGLHPGDFVLFHAAAGGVGLIACQWAKALGLQLIGTAGSDEKCALAKDLGAAHVINYNKEDFLPIVKKITSGKGVKVVYDSVGKDTWDRSLDCLRPFGLMASFGNSSGPPAPFAPGILAQKGSLYVTRQVLFAHIASREAAQEMADDLFDIVTCGKVKIRIDQTFPLARASDAHIALEARKTTGCTILLPWQSVVKVGRSTESAQPGLGPRAMRLSGDEPKSPNIEHIRASERRSPDGMQRSCPEGRLRARMPADFRHGLQIGANMKPTGHPNDEAASAKITHRIQELSDWRGATLAHVRQLIHEADPGIEEEWKWAKPKSPGIPIWSHDGIVCTGETYKQVVKLTFARGASIKDPKKLFNSSLEGNVRRAIDLREGEKINEAAFKQLIRAAVAANFAGRAQRAVKKQ